MFKNKITKIFICYLFVLIFAANANFALAMRLPEIQYPPVPFPGIETPNQFIQKIISGVYSYTPEKALSLYVKYFYYLALTIAGLLALGAIIYGGFQYLISRGSPVKMVDARQQIAAGVSGLLLLFSSYIILTTINPQLAILNFGAPAIEKCDCAQPPANLSEYCQRTCQRTVPPSETVPIYIEIPIGRMVERVVQAGKAAEEKASLANIAAEDLRKKTQELKDETQNCERCGSARTDCPGACSGGSCRLNGRDDCPTNQDQINFKKDNQQRAIQELEEKKAELFTAAYYLSEEKYKLELAEFAMRDSLSPPISFESFISNNQATSTRISPWLDVNKETDPLKYVRSQIATNLPGNDGAEDPATFYIPEKGNEELISIIENLTFSGPIPGPQPGPQPPPPATLPPPAGTTYQNFADTARSFAISPFQTTVIPSHPNHQLYINADPTELKTSALHYGADCGVYVATVMRATIDPGYPKINTGIQQSHLEANSDFNCFSISSASELRPGDILFATSGGGHVSIWLDDGEWQASLIDAFSPGFLPTGPLSYWTPRMNYVCRYKNF